MKAMRKILPALCMLLVSAVMLGSSTFAWFSSNSSVTATGMHLTAEAAESLFISNTAGYAEDTFKASVVFTSENILNTKVKPVAYENLEKLKANTFYRIKDEDMDKIGADGKVDDFTLTAAKNNTTDMNKNVFKESFKLKVAGSQAKKISVTAAFTDASAANAMKNMIHVVLINNKMENDEDIKNIDMGNDNKTIVLIDSLTANSDSDEWIVYVFVDGNDTDCKNQNATAEFNFEIKLTFTMENAA